MNDENNSNESCPQCQRHCPADSTECIKGSDFTENRADHHAMEPAERDSQFNREGLESRLMHLFMKCIHLLHHSKGSFYHGRSRILRILSERGGITQRELMDLLGIRSSSVSELLAKIEADGYIIRKKSEDDLRNVEITLTESGIKAARKHEHDGRQSAADLFSVLNEEERLQLENTLRKLLSSWEKEDGSYEHLLEHEGHKGHGCCNHHGEHGMHGHRHHPMG